MTTDYEGEDVQIASMRDKNPWLAAEDIFGTPVVVTIAAVKLRRSVTLEGGRKEDVLVAYLTSKSGRPLTKALIMTKTRIRAMDMGLGHGKKVANWVGLEIALYAAQLKTPKFDRTHGIRIAVDSPNWIDKTVVGNGKLPDDVRKALGW